jgi:hypothetical protein
MTILPMFPEHDSESDDTPLPLLVAKKWDFPLAFHIVDDKYFYAIQDWVRGLTETEDIRLLWGQFKKQEHWNQMLISNQRLPYRASDGKVYQRDYTIDENLYTIAQYLRVTRARPVLNEIRQFLSKAGVFVDEVRLDPTRVLTSGAISPDQAIDAGIEMYRAQGKSDAWIQMRVESKIKRDTFVKALGHAIAEVLNRRHYAIATNDIYTGLWQRTAAKLKQELLVSKNGSLRDRQPTMALYFQGIAEEACADKLDQRQELSWNEARDIIKTVSSMVGRYAKEMSEYLGKDLATGRPLLPS